MRCFENTKNGALFKSELIFVVTNISKTYFVCLEVEMTENRGVTQLEAQVFLNLIRTEEELMGAVKALLKEQRLSAPQYNVLRILRGAGSEGLPCQQISERMVSRLPDITRLLDRLEGGELVTRERSPEDRRIVLARITVGGRAVLERLDEPMAELHGEQFSALSRQELLQLNALLRKVRATCSG